MSCRDNFVYAHIQWETTWQCKIIPDIANIMVLTHWGRVTHIFVSKLTITVSDNGLSPDRCQAIIWTNAGILLIEPLGTNFNEMLIKVHTFSFKKIRLKVSSGNWWPFCLGLNKSSSIIQLYLLRIKSELMYGTPLHCPHNPPHPTPPSHPNPHPTCFVVVK